MKSAVPCTLIDADSILGADADSDLIRVQPVN